MDSDNLDNLLDAHQYECKISFVSLDCKSLGLHENILVVKRVCPTMLYVEQTHMFVSIIKKQTAPIKIP